MRLPDLLSACSTTDAAPLFSSFLGLLMLASHPGRLSFEKVGLSTKMSGNYSPKWNHQVQYQFLCQQEHNAGILELEYQTY